MSSFNLKEAFPDMDSHPYDWRVDKYEPHRVWWTVRNTATHTGPLKFFGSTYKPTGKVDCPVIAQQVICSIIDALMGYTAACRITPSEPLSGINCTSIMSGKC